MAKRMLADPGGGTRKRQGSSAFKRTVDQTQEGPLVWSEEARAFLGPHEHRPVATEVEMSTSLRQEAFVASKKETQTQISPPLFSRSPGFSEPQFLSSVKMSWAQANLQGMLGSSWEPIPIDGLCNLKDATPTSGIIQVFLLPAHVGSWAKPPARRGAGF